MDTLPEWLHKRNPPYKGIRRKGSIIIHEDVNINIPITEKIMIKYLGDLQHPMAQALLGMQQKNGQSVILEISPKLNMVVNISANTKAKADTAAAVIVIRENA